jgi:hypothetical protein
MSINVQLANALAADDPSTCWRIHVTITADIVTVDNSLVLRLKVDRHTGTIEYQN